MRIKIKRIFALLTSLSLISIGITSYLVYINFIQSETIESQAVLLKKNKQNDADYFSSARNISDSIKTVVSKLNYVINGEEYSSDEIADKYITVLNERNKYRTMFGMAKKEYGFNLNSIEDGDVIYYKWGKFSRADSADITYRLFKKRIKKTKNGWEYDATSKSDLENLNNQLKKEVLPLARDIIKKSGDTGLKN